MKTLLTILSIGYSTFSFSQSDFLKDRKPDLELGLDSYSSIKNIELGLNLFKEYGHGGVMGDALILGSELGMKNNSFLVAPKLTYSYYLFIINGSISLTNYNYDSKHSLYIRPEAGISLVSFIDLVYGYNIPIVDRNIEFQGSTLTLRMRLFGCMK